MDWIAVLKTVAKWILGAFALLLVIAVSKKFTIFHDARTSRGCHFPVNTVHRSVRESDSADVTSTWRTGDIVFFDILRNRPLLKKGWEHFVMFNSNCSYPHIGMVVRDTTSGQLGVLSYGFAPKHFQLPSFKQNADVDTKWHFRPLRNVLRAANSILYMPLKKHIEKTPADVMRGLETFGHRDYALTAYVNYLFMRLIKCTEKTLFCSSGLLYLLASMGMVDTKKLEKEFIDQNRSLDDLYICLACDFWRNPIGSEIAKSYDTPTRIRVTS